MLAGLFQKLFVIGAKVNSGFWYVRITGILIINGAIDNSNFAHKGEAIRRRINIENGIVDKLQESRIRLHYSQRIHTKTANGYLKPQIKPNPTYKSPRLTTHDMFQINQRR